MNLSEIKKNARIIKWSRSIGNKQIAELFVNNGGPLHLLNSDGKTITFGQSVISVTPDNAALINGSWRLIKNLAENDSVKFSISNHDKGALMTDVSGIKVVVETYEEVFIIHEIFERKIYGLCDRGPCHIMDIGANVGMASLYFSLQPWVTGISAFEPLSPTFEKAQMHLNLNSESARKIQIYNFGLGAVDKTLSVDYSPTYKGSVGMNGSPDFVKKAGDCRTETLRVRDASAIFNEIGKKLRGEKIIVKMDCEGAEYEILPNLVASGEMHKVSAFMIEWHDLGPGELEKLLLENGFICWRVRADEERELGILYAVQSRPA